MSHSLSDPTTCRCFSCSNAKSLRTDRARLEVRISQLEQAVAVLQEGLMELCECAGEWDREGPEPGACYCCEKLARAKEILK